MFHLHLLAAIAFTTSPQNLLWISGLVGVGLPHVIAILSQQHWNSGLKAVLAFVVCLVAAVIICWIKGTLNFSDWATSAGVVFVLARTSYAALWKPTGINDALEARTTVTRPSGP